MGTAKDILGGEPSTSVTRPMEIPGLYGRDEGRLYAQRAANLAGSSPNATLESLLTSDLMRGPVNTGGSPYESAIRSAVTNPAQFGGLSDSERNLVEQAYSGRQATFNALGTGASPGSQSAIAAAAAPTLAALRQQRISDLMQGESLYQQGQGLNITSRGQFLDTLLKGLQSSLAQRGQTLESYLNLARLGLPALGSSTTASGGRSPWNVEVKFPDGSGAGVGGD